jgi:hypothetical protein
MEEIVNRQIDEIRERRESVVQNEFNIFTHDELMMIRDTVNERITELSVDLLEAQRFQPALIPERLRDTVAEALNTHMSDLRDHIGIWSALQTKIDKATHYASEAREKVDIEALLQERKEQEAEKHTVHEDDWCDECNNYH